MKSSWHGDAFRITGPLWDDSTGHRRLSRGVAWIGRFDIFFDVSMSQLLNKQSSWWRFETPWRYVRQLQWFFFNSYWMTVVTMYLIISKIDNNQPGVWSNARITPIVAIPRAPGAMGLCKIGYPSETHLKLKSYESSFFRPRDPFQLSTLLALCEGNPPVTGGFLRKGQWRGAVRFS